jgi:hypothetical protein
MGKSALLAWAGPVPGRTDEFVDWYETVHIPEVRTAIPAIEKVTRYRLVDPAEPERPARFLTVYDLGDVDATDAAASLGAAAAAGGLQPHGAMDLVNDPPVLQWCVVDSADAF